MAYESVARHERARHLAEFQSGVLSRQQLLSVGWTAKAIYSQITASRWQSLASGVYLTHTGVASIRAWWWAAHLMGGDRSYLAGLSALQAWGLDEPRLPVHVAVPWRRHFLSAQSELVIIRHRFPAPTRSRGGLPPYALAEYAAIEASEKMASPRRVAAVVTEICQKGHTTPGKLAHAMTSYKRLRHRKLLLELVVEVRDGANSVLEFDGVRLVLNAHGLPKGAGQVRERANGAVVYRDRVIHEYGVIVEFDGRLGHADPSSRLRDDRRDLLALEMRRVTVRLGWADVHEDACRSAIQLARILRSRGWPGAPSPCGPMCPARRQDWATFVPL